MGLDLALTEQELGSAAGRIDALVADLEAASERRGAILDGIGTSSQTRELRDAIAAFDSTWRIRREGLQESLAGLAGVLRQIDHGFDDADSSLVRSLAPSGSAHASSRIAV